MQYDFSDLPAERYSDTLFYAVASVVVAVLSLLDGYVWFGLIGISDTLDGIGFLATLVGVGYLYVHFHKGGRTRESMVSSWAAKNHLTNITDTLKPADVPPVIREYLSLDDWRPFCWGYALQFGDVPAKVFGVLGAAQRGHSGLYWVVQLELSAKLPHVYLDSRGNGFGEVYAKRQRLSLEGDFDRYFNLYLPDRAQVDVLSIITPDIMRTLMESGRKYDIEIAGNRAYICSETDFFWRGEMPFLLAFADHLAADLSHRAVSWQGLATSVGGRRPGRSLRVRPSANDILDRIINAARLVVLLIIALMVVFALGQWLVKAV